MMIKKIFQTIKLIVKYMSLAGRIESQAYYLVVSKEHRHLR